MADLKAEMRIEGADAGNEIGKHRPRHMIADAERRPPRRCLLEAERAVVGGQQLAGAVEERGALGGEPRKARRALDQPRGEAALPAA